MPVRTCLTLLIPLPWSLGCAPAACAGPPLWFLLQQPTCFATTRWTTSIRLAQGRPLQYTRVMLAESHLGRWRR